MSSEIKVKPSPFKEYKKDDLMNLEKQILRGILRERVHHRIEVPLNSIISKWEGKPIKSFGKQAQLVFEVWKERGFPLDEPDIQWAKKYCDLANKIQQGKNVELNLEKPEPFSEGEMEVVNKLIYKRCSIRNWIDKPIPEKMIKKILEAGRAAPIGCNMGEIRFLLLKSPEEKKIIRSDISTENAVIIVICYDKRIPEALGHDNVVPQNPGYDAAAAADHMLLMTHALGLGGVWLSRTAESEYTKDSGEEFRKKFGLPEYIKVALHIAIGWPERGTIKSKRLPLEEMML